jgi:hypothetical protein
MLGRLFHDGRTVERIHGAASAREICEIIEEKKETV